MTALADCWNAEQNWTLHAETLCQVCAVGVQLCIVTVCSNLYYKLKSKESFEYINVHAFCPVGMVTTCG